MSPALTIVIPTKDRPRELEGLLASIAGLDQLKAFCPEIIVSDNNPQDGNSAVTVPRCFPCALQTIEVTRAGKSAAINEAVRIAQGEVVAFLDDDVVVDKTWLVEVNRFLRQEKYEVGQGRILLPPSEASDPEVNQLLQRFRTIPYLNFAITIDEVHSLNGANFIIRRELLNRLGGFNERLGPGASGTSEDVELSQRVRKAGYPIGYMRDATVYHKVDRSRLTEEYFKASHRRQGQSRLLIKPRSTAHILCSLGRVSLQHVFYLTKGQERKSYRSKGRIQHYLGMLEARRKSKS
jgi:GT2 family glycosyltransferase